MTTRLDDMTESAHLTFDYEAIEDSDDDYIYTEDEDEVWSGTGTGTSAPEQSPAGQPLIQLRRPKLISETSTELTAKSVPEVTTPSKQSLNVLSNSSTVSPKTSTETKPNESDFVAEIMAKFGNSLSTPKTSTETMAQNTNSLASIEISTETGVQTNQNSQTLAEIVAENSSFRLSAQNLPKTLIPSSSSVWSESLAKIGNTLTETKPKLSANSSSAQFSGHFGSKLSDSVTIPSTTPVVDRNCCSMQSTNSSEQFERHIETKVAANRQKAVRRLDDYLMKAINGLDINQRLSVGKWFSQIEPQFQTLVTNDVKDVNELDVMLSEFCAAVEGFDSMNGCSGALADTQFVFEAIENRLTAEEIAIQTDISGNILIENIFHHLI